MTEYVVVLTGSPEAATRLAELTGVSAFNSPRTLTDVIEDIVAFTNCDDREGIRKALSDEGKLTDG